MEGAVQITDPAALVVVISPAQLLRQHVVYQDIPLVGLMLEAVVVQMATHAKLMDVVPLPVSRTAKHVELVHISVRLH